MQWQNQPWPVELRQPIVLGELQKTVSRNQRGKDFDIDLMNAVREEKIQRVERVCSFLSQYDDSGILPPTLPVSEDQWLQLIIVFGEYLNVPAFQVEMTKSRGPGATKIWTDKKLFQLFADVQRLAKGTLSEYAACQFIATRPKKFGNRYLARNGCALKATTLHRQFLCAKSKITSQRTYRVLMVGEVGAEFTPAFVSEAIKRYAYS